MRLYVFETFAVLCVSLDYWPDRSLARFERTIDGYSNANIEEMG